MTGEELDRIGAIFKNKTVFISGATGFLGKVLIEKLLRVTEVRRLYLLVRTKKGLNPKERLQDIFKHVLFSRLRQERPESINKCQIITGDVLEKDLGISLSDRKIIQNEVDFIVHSAASTRFDDTIEYAVRMNTLGTHYMLNLAKECRKLQLFVHISTAFAFPKEKVLLDKAYPPPADSKEVLDIILKENSTPADQNLLNMYYGDCPNTYTFSKALAEDFVNKEMDNLPVIIVRPSVVVPTYQEPLPGYFNNLQSPMGIFVGACKGVIRSVHIDSKANANMIPADSVINLLLVTAWDYVANKSNHRFCNMSVPQEDLIITWESLVEHGKGTVKTVPFNQILWYPEGIMTKYKLWHYIHVFLFQLIPAIFIDLLLLCLGYKPILLAINQRLLKGQEMFDYFTTHRWIVNVKYALKLRTYLNEVERKQYNLDARNVNIGKYMEDCVLYARRHIFHETDDRLPAARRNIKIFYVLDRTIKFAFFAYIFYYIYRKLFVAANF
ncbi:hypothetical protein ABEB36_014260 [Hypothenemus hampei]|uniref:Fatty acyl-CoA reductase n=1 Tax=Hypothenemus hampei TaxID=57062 RepID=A0ABD1E5Z6_HYPHA